MPSRLRFVLTSGAPGQAYSGPMVPLGILRDWGFSKPTWWAHSNFRKRLSYCLDQAQRTWGGLPHGWELHVFRERRGIRGRESEFIQMARLTGCKRSKEFHKLPVPNKAYPKNYRARINREFEQLAAAKPAPKPPKVGVWV
jgi:hypothetical protein